MAKFTFQLQGLLRQRERVEQERQRDVALANAELLAARADLEQVDRTVQEALDDLRQNRLTGPIDLSFLTAHRRFMLAMQRQGAERAQRVAVAQHKAAAAEKLLAEAAKQRKAIEVLREQQQERWRADQDRRETMAGDEVAMQMAVESLRAEGDELDHGGAEGRP